MRRFQKKKFLLLFIGGTGLIWYTFCLPGRLFKDTYCTVLEDRSGQLLSASIASDGQWRFPEGAEVPEKFSRAITAYEDKRFWSHPGVDPLSLARAVKQNFRARRIVSGGSTLTMQVVRLSRRNPPRTLWQKLIEIIVATRVEWRYSKKEILSLYASHAPFGGNVVGLEAACWRYFGRSARELSWSESALLAVLPNNPSLIHLSRNRDVLRRKRNRLLEILYQQGAFDQVSYELAAAEQLPEEPNPIPRHAAHLLDRAKQEGFDQTKVKSTVDIGMQIRAEQAVDDYFQKIAAKQIFNAALLILEIENGKVLAYVGNTRSGKEHQENVDVVRANRSTGSILKPFLYAALLNEGKLLPEMLVADVPVMINGFAPKNFSREYDGAVPADQALVRSLNVPAVLMLREYRYEKFYSLMTNMGMTTLSKPPDHYGLSLVLGGAEGSLWDITGIYASNARTLNHYFEFAGKNRYNKTDYHPPVYTLDAQANGSQNKIGEMESNSYLTAASIWQTFESLQELHRPAEESGWIHFNSTKPVAWKTGTSFGFRDGWAVGVNPDYAVGVWIGNADGEGRPGLTGTELAAPLMFEIFSMLPGQSWFQKPESELETIAVCSLSGHRAGQYCTRVDSMSVPLSGLVSAACVYHRPIHLTRDEKFRVHLDCAKEADLKTVNWFVLPPLQEYYFKRKNMGYKQLPPFGKGCEDPSSIASMDIIYPKVNAQLYLPVQLDGQVSGIVFEAAHRNSQATVYWHLDGEFIGATKKDHQMLVIPSYGKHWLSLVDGSGETIQRSFMVISAR